MRVGKCAGRRSAGLPWERALVAMVFGGCGGCGGCVVWRSGGVVGSLREALKPGVSDGDGGLASVFRGPPRDHS